MTLQEFIEIAKKSVKISIDYTALEAPVIAELQILVDGIQNSTVKMFAAMALTAIKTELDKVIAAQPK